MPKNVIRSLQVGLTIDFVADCNWNRHFYVWKLYANLRRSFWQHALL